MVLSSDSGSHAEGGNGEDVFCWAPGAGAEELLVLRRGDWVAYVLLVALAVLFTGTFFDGSLSTIGLAVEFVVLGSEKGEVDDDVSKIKDDLGSAAWVLAEAVHQAGGASP